MRNTTTVDNPREASVLASHLAPGEHLIYRTKLSLIIFRWSGLLVALGLMAWRNVGADLGLPLIAAGVVAFGVTSLRRASSEWGLTRTRLIAKTGVVRHRLFDIPLDSIESVTVTQGIFGRIYGYGTITIVGDGGTDNTFDELDEPLLFVLRARQLTSELSVRALRA